ncbi:hypothetical protein OGAPHI_007358 [Ogataea philodendri]|uniref:Uncharacterized protein n=1 Tax=Ogataea philodendri TaxID=1378263 RepID=A0A9P8SYX6_9ASCO|nr:uncharacterized protein OGAPHI_007358 [Ogataea philodendri]KAH3660153.1 hypothetical protein OGAPHI_007358 [Ogataea philodendri]
MAIPHRNHSTRPTIRIVTSEATDENTGDVSAIKARNETLKIRFENVDRKMYSHCLLDVGNWNLCQPRICTTAIGTITTNTVLMPIRHIEKFENVAWRLALTSFDGGQHIFLYSTS